ncbi:ArsR/SmtB family transcription factor [Paenibacillus agricola]|uniref:Helix-turn-helix transcriptional regulator n=1 Tax=Paenibacillus agricola TaxID=2716264 RepID=A0ABX0J3G7_9BACL|nr:helix-turn-helix transcriptional regulator [Paenibacillus agricola]NHN30533.1 helix-turn-helix transcriptional regulator [Paenibacillus agricola]
MDILKVIKALSNETRYNILDWLKTPEDNFSPQIHLAKDGDFQGVCVGSISEKTGLAQSVVSGYLVKLQAAGLLESRRIGQWTYYRRDEEGIRNFVAYLQSEL